MANFGGAQLPYIVTLSLVAIALDLLLLLAWRHRKRTGEWPTLPLPSFREQAAIRLGQFRSLFADWMKPSTPTSAPGWRGYIAEFALAAAIILIALLVLLSRHGSPTPDSSQPLPAWLVWVYVLRQSVVRSSITWALLLPLALAGLLTFATSRRDAQLNTRRMAGLSLVLMLAVEAQIALVVQKTALGVIFYFVMAAVLWRWWRVFGLDLGEDWWNSKLSGRTELVIVGGIFILTAVARLYGIGAYPFGVEGDESKWTVEVVRWMLDGV